MRKVPSPEIFRHVRGVDRRCGAALFAVLALLFQTALFPALHFALGVEPDGGPSVAAIHHTHHHGSGDTDRSGHGDHGPCHFCRLLGAALPPPSDVALLLPAPERAVFAPVGVEVQPTARRFRSHRVRAPPGAPIRV